MAKPRSKPATPAPPLPDPLPNSRDITVADITTFNAAYPRLIALLTQRAAAVQAAKTTAASASAEPHGAARLASLDRFRYVTLPARVAERRRTGLARVAEKEAEKAAIPRWKLPPPPPPGKKGKKPKKEKSEKDEKERAMTDGRYGYILLDELKELMEWKLYVYAPPLLRAVWLAPLLLSTVNSQRPLQELWQT